MCDFFSAIWLWIVTGCNWYYLCVVLLTFAIAFFTPFGLHINAQAMKNSELIRIQKSFSENKALFSLLNDYYRFCNKKVFKTNLQDISIRLKYFSFSEARIVLSSGRLQFISNDAVSKTINVNYYSYCHDIATMVNTKLFSSSFFESYIKDYKNCFKGFDLLLSDLATCKVDVSKLTPAENVLLEKLMSEFLNEKTDLLIDQLDSVGCSIDQFGSKNRKMAFSYIADELLPWLYEIYFIIAVRNVEGESGFDRQVTEGKVKLGDALNYLQKKKMMQRINPIRYWRYRFVRKNNLCARYAIKALRRYVK